jgi:hypothetical protein
MLSAMHYTLGRYLEESAPRHAEDAGSANADGNLFAETYNQLNAYFATVPGNYALNLRQLYLLNTNYADLSFLFTIHTGEKTNEHLDAEYMAVVETDNAILPQAAHPRHWPYSDSRDDRQWQIIPSEIRTSSAASQTNGVATAGLVSTGGCRRHHTAAQARNH